MNAPIPPTATAPADAILVARAPLTAFAPSLTNRKHTPDYIAELGESIKADDVIQPITARPWPQSRGPAPEGVLYEIVIGEGRWLGSLYAAKADIPFFWRDLTDHQALKLQLIENLKRKNLTAIEEAEGYRRLMKDHGLNADQIAAEIGVKGKSRSYVYGRLKLLDLSPSALKYFDDGQLDASTALLVARIPDPKLQEKAAKEIAQGEYHNGEPMSYRAAADHVQRRYMLKLPAAPFSRADANLVASAGRCHECPKRTGNEKDLFADVKSADVCTDPGCYEAKCAAHIKHQQELAKAEGRNVIKGDAAKKIMPYQHSDLTGGYVSLDKEVYVDGKFKSVRQILGADAPQADLLMDPHKANRMIEVVSAASIKDQLAAKGIDNVIRGSAGKSDKEKAEQKAAKLREKISIAFSQRLFDHVRSQLIMGMNEGEAPYLKLTEARMVAVRMFALTSHALRVRVARLWLGPKDEKPSDWDLVNEFEERIGQLFRKDLDRLMMDLTLIYESGVSYEPEFMLAVAKNRDIETDALKVEVRQELTPKAPAPKKPAAKSKAAPAVKVQPETALPADSPLAIGDRVRVNDSVRSPIGSSYIGKTGTTTGTIGEAFMVRFENRFACSYMRSELDKLAPADPSSTPSEAAPAAGLSAPKPATPAKPKGKKTGATSPEAKADPAPAAPSNEPAAPVKTTGAKAPKTAQAKTSPAPAAPANEPATPVKTATSLSPAQAWPFPVGNRPDAPPAPNIIDALEAAGQERLVP